jgi:hypothetical protein
MLKNGADLSSHCLINLIGPIVKIFTYIYFIANLYIKYISLLIELNFGYYSVILQCFTHVIWCFVEISGFLKPPEGLGV